MHQEVSDLQIDGGKLDHLMGVVKRRRSKLAMPTGTRGGIEVLHRGGLK